MVRRFIILVMTIILMGGLFAFSRPKPVQAQATPGCWELITTSQFSAGGGNPNPFHFLNPNLVLASPGDQLLVEVTSDYPLDAVVAQWIATITTGQSTYFDPPYSAGPTGNIMSTAFIFDLSNPNGDPSFSHVPLGGTSPIHFVLDLWNLDPTPANGTYAIYISTTGCPEDTGQPAYVDGRLCFWDEYAVYTDEDSIDVYRISNSRGSLILSVSQDEIDALGEHPDTHVLIESDPAVQVYALAGGDTYEVHVAPFIFGGARFARFNGLPAQDIVCDVVH